MQQSLLFFLLVPITLLSVHLVSRWGAPPTCNSFRIVKELYVNGDRTEDCSWGHALGWGRGEALPQAVVGELYSFEGALGDLGFSPMPLERLSLEFQSDTEGARERLFESILDQWLRQSFPGQSEFRREWLRPLVMEHLGYSRNKHSLRWPINVMTLQEHCVNYGASSPFQTICLKDAKASEQLTPWAMGHQIAKILLEVLSTGRWVSVRPLVIRRIIAFNEVNFDLNEEMLFIPEALRLKVFMGLSPVMSWLDHHKVVEILNRHFPSGAVVKLNSFDSSLGENFKLLKSRSYEDPFVWNIVNRNSSYTLVLPDSHSQLRTHWPQGLFRRELKVDRFCGVPSPETVAREDFKRVVYLQACDKRKVEGELPLLPYHKLMKALRAQSEIGYLEFYPASVRTMLETTDRDLPKPWSVSQWKKWLGPDHSSAMGAHKILLDQ